MKRRRRRKGGRGGKKNRRRGQGVLTEWILLKIIFTSSINIKI